MWSICADGSGPGVSCWLALAGILARPENSGLAQGPTAWLARGTMA
jgi:hypothetical protein